MTARGMRGPHPELRTVPQEYRGAAMTVERFPQRDSAASSRLQHDAKFAAGFREMEGDVCDLARMGDIAAHHEHAVPVPGERFGAMACQKARHHEAPAPIIQEAE